MRRCWLVVFYSLPPCSMSAPPLGRYIKITGAVLCFRSNYIVIRCSLILVRGGNLTEPAGEVRTAVIRVTRVVYPPS
ncbi:hypothetical protein F5Y03DRAFT_339894 [Xylaria venustula]|nr:hypothetical protein F5Y03DRAFT_339894 [Xylaria venustula]